METNETLTAWELYRGHGATVRPLARQSHPTMTMVSVVSYGPDVSAGMRHSIPVGGTALVHPDDGHLRADGTICLHEGMLREYHA